MPEDSFNKRKKDVLSKTDKSSKGSWDDKIVQLCKKINSMKNYYTTSSCSGRVVLMIDQEKKAEGLFIKTTHEKVSFEQIKSWIREVANNSQYKDKLIKFKQEPCILHVACNSFSDAKTLCNKAKLAGWKKSGIIAYGKRFVVELSSTERMEFPIIEEGNILVNDKFLKTVARECNKKLKSCWSKIGKLKKMIK